ncbi:Imm49 family immunity protein [Motilimonas pumila]|uniref:Uncharacterized protein n=1 Tax=Motilimonas pumila TaxID=2303987 RepID=A0A418YI04_9GAMM|nr:Imm49 family immunity protein [Motilimonas pumila]RJG49959.1 hypothetical protein D1Z90_04760 [Motilimonas pumila]
MNHITHHNKTFFNARWQENSEHLLNQVEKRHQSLSKNFKEARAQSLALSFSDDFFHMFVQAVQLNWPKPHCIWLLSHAAELAWMHQRMLIDQGQLTPITCAGEEFVLTPAASTYGTGLGQWLNALNLNLLLRQPDEVINELLRYPADLMDHHNAANQSMEAEKKEMACFKAFVANALQPDLIDAANALTPYTQPGVISKLNGFEGHVAKGTEGYHHYVLFPIISTLLSCAKVQEENISITTKNALAAFYEYHAFISPDPGEDTGEKSLQLFSDEAMLPLQLIGMLALHHQRTGETIDFTTDYLPSWLVEGDFPSREEVLFQQPPTFDLASVKQ